MQPLYMDDSYLKEFDATVEEATENRVVLNNTAFFPAGGGVPNDTGTITCNDDVFSVVNVAKENGNIMHHLDKAVLKAGDIVKCAINWNRRYKLMRMHTAAHLLSAVFNREANVFITGNQLDLDKSRMDFSLENFDREKMTKFFEIANDLTQKNIPVKTYYMDRSEAEKIEGIARLAKGLPDVQNLRIVEIEGVDMQADGGCHVRDLKEVGQITFLKAENKGQNNRRIYYTLN
jgi:misacylated tRNA(Ala) deacylase